MFCHIAGMFIHIHWFNARSGKISCPLTIKTMIPGFAVDSCLIFCAVRWRALQCVGTLVEDRDTILFIFPVVITFCFGTTRCSISTDPEEVKHNINTVALMCTRHRQLLYFPLHLSTIDAGLFNLFYGNSMELVLPVPPPWFYGRPNYQQEK